MITRKSSGEIVGGSGRFLKGCIRFDLVKLKKGGMSMGLVRRLWCEQEGQDIAEYAVMLAVILVIVVGTIRLIGSNANNVFSSVASSIQ
jgi:Flp pilus assembly pilin Flp